MRIATAVGFAVLLAVAGVGAFLLARDPAPAPTPTTTTAPTDNAVAVVIADRLAAGLRAPLSEIQADCLARSLLAVVGRPALTALTENPNPIGEIPIAQREAITVGIVDCVPPEVAAVLLAPQPLPPP